MLDTYRLRLQNRAGADIALGPGVHALGVDRNGVPTLVDDSHDAVARISIDRRGVWLRVRDDVRGLHVNGRPVSRVAQLRGGDCLYVEGEGLMLLGREPRPPSPVPDRGPPSALLLRGVGGAQHGRCFPVPARGAHRGPIAAAALAQRGVRVAAHPRGIELHADAGTAVTANGHPVEHGLLLPGDQLEVGGQRFVVEGALAADVASPPAAAPRADEPSLAPASRRRSLRVPWMLVAAMLLSAALALLLLYGPR